MRSLKLATSTCWCLVALLSWLRGRAKGACPSGEAGSGRDRAVLLPVLPCDSLTGVQPGPSPVCSSSISGDRVEFSSAPDLQEAPPGGSSLEANSPPPPGPQPVLATPPLQTVNLERGQRCPAQGCSSQRLPPEWREGASLCCTWRTGLGSQLQASSGTLCSSRQPVSTLQ